ncbi:MAG: NADPH-dependent glutamate synthase [Bacteroidales bacterium]|nr:NADPH-dependent glutamate synthase [Bacteroidales bacterium]
MAERIPRVPVREQDPKVRAHNFEEVCYGYNLEEAMLEASRCLHCKNPRCVAACPVSIKIPEFIAKVKEGDIQGAASVISEDSSLPAVCGRVCPQETQCEGSCVLGVKFEPVAIGKLERFVADHTATESEVLRSEATNAASAAASESRAMRGMKDAGAQTEGLGTVPLGGAGGYKGTDNGHKVAIIGSGPAGLACASDLAKWGYDVTIFEALHRPGGVLEYGIPEFRLPKDAVLKREINEVKALGVKIETDVIIGRTVTIDSLMDDEGFEAVFVGTGAGLPKFMGIPGENLNGVFSANEFLTRNNLMKAFREDYLTPIHAGKKCCVVGGGNVAMDAARTALRLGADTSIIYRRTEVELPARKEEVHHAKEEGIDFQMLTNPVEILADENGWVRALKCIRMELGEPDESGRRSPVPIPGSEFEIPTETVIMALGTAPNPLIVKTTGGLEATRRGGLVADEDGRTTREGIFAGGDAVTGAATVILAMGAGRKAAKAIDDYLKNK